MLSWAWLLAFLYTAVPVLDLMHGDWNIVMISCVVTSIDALCVAVHVVPVVTEATMCKFFTFGALIPNAVVAVGARKQKYGSLRHIMTGI